MLQHFPVPAPVMRGLIRGPGNSGLAMVPIGYIAASFYLSSRPVIKRLAASSRRCQRVGYAGALPTRIDWDGWPSGANCAFADPPCGLICLAHKRNFMRRPATNWHDGQITKNLSSPSHKNIPLNLSGKSFA
jgi:hypothetical protein